MSNRRTSQFAAGVMAALCGLAAPARAQYPIPIRRRPCIAPLSRRALSISSRQPTLLLV